MKLKTLAAGLLIVSSSMNIMAADTNKAEDTKAVTTDSALTSDAQKLSYSLGALLAGRIKSDFDDLDLDAIVTGMKDVMAGKEPALTQAEMQQAINSARETKAMAMQVETEAKASENLEKATKFLDENKKAEGVITTDSGLQYKITKKGSANADKPTLTSEVVVHYEGSLLDGTVFDSSFERGEPARFRLDQVIPGWTEALQLMSTGTEANLWIPANLAYGERGVPGTIGPNEVLKFKVELQEVVAPEADADAPAAEEEAPTAQTEG